MSIIRSIIMKRPGHDEVVPAVAAARDEPFGLRATPKNPGKLKARRE